MLAWQFCLVAFGPWLLLGIQQTQAASVIVPANGFAWTIPYFPGANKCVIANASLAVSVPTTANLSMTIIDQADFEWFRADPSRAYKPAGSLVCQGSHVTNCVIAYGGLQTGVNYTLVFFNSQAYGINVTFQYSLGCPSGSPLLKGGGFAGSSVTTVASGVAFGQTPEISGSECLRFYAVAEADVPLKAWVVTTTTANSLARNPSGYTTSFPYVTGGFCRNSQYCNITLTNLSPLENYTIFYQPDGQIGKARYVAHSLFSSCLSTSFIVLPSKLLPLGPITGTRNISYSIQPDLNVLTAVIDSSGVPIGNTRYRIKPNDIADYSSSGLSPAATYWIGIQHNDIRNDSAELFFTLLQPSYTGSSSSGRKLLQHTHAPFGHQLHRPGRSLLAPTAAPNNVVSAAAPAGSASLGASITSAFSTDQQSFLSSNGIASGYSSDQASTAVENARISSIFK